MIKIKETNIPDITNENLDKSKQNLAENIVNYVQPFFDETYTKKEYEYNELQDQLSVSHKKLLNKKNELENLMIEVKRKRKINKLLERLEKLIFSDKPFETSLKHETIILLKTINKMSDERLDYNLNRTIKIIGKRFANK